MLQSCPYLGTHTELKLIMDFLDEAGAYHLRGESHHSFERNLLRPRVRSVPVSPMVVLQVGVGKIRTFVEHS